MKRLVAIAALCVALGGSSALVLPGCAPKLSTADAVRQANISGTRAIYALRAAVGQAYDTAAQLTDAGRLNAAQADDVRKRLRQVEGYLDHAETALNTGLSYAPQIEQAVNALIEAQNLTRGTES